MRTPLTLLLLAILAAVPTDAAGQDAYSHPLYVAAEADSGLPLVVPEDSRQTAGTWDGDTLVVYLAVQRAELRPEGPDFPGLIVAAVGQAGTAPSVPAPLIRVPEGAYIRVEVTNSLTDSTLTVHGLGQRPIASPENLVIPPGERGNCTFLSGQAGTYLYRIEEGRTDRGSSERDLMAGALIIDPPDRAGKADRVIVMNILGTWDPIERRPLEALLMNGRSWPYAETFEAAVGDTLRWRVINASQRVHPMHLHGFYYDVLARGSVTEAEKYPAERVRSVVTERMTGLTTMEMQWVASRPGTWLFHCHLSFHVSPHIRLPGAAESDPAGHHPHMAGLVNGIRVSDGPSDLIERFEPRHLTLRVQEEGDADSTRAYALELIGDTTRARSGGPGPLMLLRQHQPTHVTVENGSSRPTGIHWHGLELDAWADGVPGWSRSDGRVSPVIAPDSSFTYKLSQMRAGTFIYHTHLDDVEQLTRGLYGPMIVLGERETYNPYLDHPLVFAWNTMPPQRPGDLVINGRLEHPDVEIRTGEAHRLRLINIAPASTWRLRVELDGEPIPLMPLAKDGADLPEALREPVLETRVLDVGETADYVFQPEKPGTYVMHFRFPRRFGSSVQRWAVR